MQQNNKKGPGLHKQVSAIFDGVPIPKDDAPKPQQVSEPENNNETSNKSKWHGWETNSRLASLNNPQPKKPETPEKQKEPKKIPNRRKELIKSLIAKVTPPHMDDSVARRQKIMALLIPILTIALVLTFVKVLNVPSPSKAGVEEEAISTEETNAPTSDVNWKLPEPFSEPIRDPMKSSLAPEDNYDQKPVDDTYKTDINMVTSTTEQQPMELEGLEIKGILYSTDKPAAIIGTEIVHEGEKVLGATIIKIYRDCIELELDGKKWKESVKP